MTSADFPQFSADFSQIIAWGHSARLDDSRVHTSGVSCCAQTSTPAEAAHCRSPALIAAQTEGGGRSMREASEVCV
jgi:DNA gyrase inhibitor GyrI